MPSNQGSRRIKYSSVNRRKLLQTLAAGSVAVTAGATGASATNVDVTPFQTSEFVEVYTQFETDIDYPRLIGCGRTHKYGIIKGELGLIEVNPSDVPDSQMVVSNEGNLLAGKEAIGGENKGSIVLENNYQRTNLEMLDLYKEVSVPEIVIRSSDNSAIELIVDGTNYKVKEGREKNIRANVRDITVTDRNGEVIKSTAEPIVSVANHGKVDIYGSEENAFIPIDPSNETERRLINEFSDGSGAEKLGEFLIIPKEVI